MLSLNNIPETGWPGFMNESYTESSFVNQLLRAPSSFLQGNHAVTSAYLFRKAMEGQ